ncbi:hypothetical protein [Kribbella ginsengisoli]|uniref:MarR family transcriptional regulator n=1 Tax=Kribbella ginsengisoli TaxID=363865 RepID=A0ABP6Z8C6_9ACTN
MSPGSEYHLLTALSLTTPRSVMVLAKMSGISRVQIRGLLQEQVREGFAAVRRQPGRVEYLLTPRGAGRLAVLQPMTKEGSVTSGDHWAASYRATIATSHAEAVSKEWAGKLLSDEDRARCAAELTRQHKMELFDDDELGRRQAELRAAVTRTQLVQVFDGLPAPRVDGLQFAPVRTSLWLKKGPVRLFYVLFAGYGIFRLVTASDWNDYTIGGVAILLALVHSRGTIRWLAATLRQRQRQKPH